MKTTLNLIRSCSPCESGWKKLLAHLGKTKADDVLVSILTILDSNGLDDALWCLQTVKGRDREIRLFGVWCARQVQHLMTDPRSLDAVDVAERFANGEADQSELDAARAAAMAAALDATRAATRAAAMAATWVVARAAASAATWDATWDAASAATWDATWDAARGAARAAARDAARAAASAATWDATWDAARGAARAAQEKRLRELCADCEGQA
jgi:hypothetical protein